MASSQIVLITLVLSLVATCLKGPSVSAFQLTHFSRPIIGLTTVHSNVLRNYRYNPCPTAQYLVKNDFPENEEEEYSGAIDWDEEWKKVVRGEGQPNTRPSGDPTSDLEKVAIKAQREAEATILKVKSQARRGVNIRSLQGDWKVC